MKILFCLIVPFGLPLYLLMKWLQYQLDYRLPDDPEEGGRWEEKTVKD